MPRMVTSAVLLGCVGLVAALVTVTFSTRRDAAIDAAFPPEGQFVEVDGRRIHAVVKGTGPDLVLIHGAGGNAQDFTYQFVDQLTDRYRVFAVDRPGLGHSDRARSGLNGAFTTDAESPIEQARLLAAATRALGAETPIVLGHSYGGAVAMAWALEEPAAAVVILSGATMPWPGDLRRYYRIFGSALGSGLGGALVSAFVPESQVRSSLDGVFAPAAVDPGYYEGAAVPLAVRRDTFRANARQVKSLRPHIVEMAARYPDVTLPVEILHGTADETVRTDIHAEPLRDALPNAELTVLDGSGHAPHHVTPKPVIAAIDRAAARAGLR
ncbi:MAG: alpha/beta hydrolase [Pseudomonadota bacterium]